MDKEEKSKGKAAVDLVGSQIGKSGASWITQVRGAAAAAAGRAREARRGAPRSGGRPAPAQALTPTRFSHPCLSPLPPGVPAHLRLHGGGDALHRRRLLRRHRHLVGAWASRPQASRALAGARPAHHFAGLRTPDTTANPDLAPRPPPPLRPALPAARRIQATLGLHRSMQETERARLAAAAAGGGGGGGGVEMSYEEPDGPGAAAAGGPVPALAGAGAGGNGATAVITAPPRPGGSPSPQPPSLADALKSAGGTAPPAPAAGGGAGAVGAAGGSASGGGGGAAAAGRAE
jgi:hypothetical protein